MNAQIKIITGEEFYDQLVDKLVIEYARLPDLKEVIRTILADGMPKFDFEYLKTILLKYFIHFEPVFVDFAQFGTEGYNYLWFVNGIDATLVLKKHVLVVDTEKMGAKVRP
jgi:hypothetical protein